MSSRSAWIRHGLLATAASVLTQPALAQTPPAAPSETPEQAAETGTQDTPPLTQDNSNEGDVIIVTGTSRARAAFDTPLSVTTLDDERLARLSSSSQGDILNTVPTIKADAGGGEVATNVFIRGLPSGGQYQFTPLMYDGIPVLSTFGLNSSAYDVYYRNDLGIDRLEFVRGGVSNLFGPGSVAGLINYISRTGGEEMHGVGQLEWAEEGRYRGDLALTGPLGSNLFYAVSGYYRSDDGPIDTNLDTKGYQIRGNLKYRFPDGNGSVTLYGQYIDDQVQFYLPVPLNGNDRSRANGNDGHDVFSVQHNHISELAFQSPDGLFTSDIAEGVKTKGGQIALAFDRDFGDGWGINGRAKWSKYDHLFGLWSDGDGVINVPESLQGFLTNRNLGSLANASFTFEDDGSAVPSNYILFANRFTDRDRPMRDWTAELNVTKELQTGALAHTFTLGGFYGNARAKDINVTTTYLAEFNNRPRLVNLTVTNPTTGAQTIISRDGLLNAGAGYTNNRHEVERYAGYFADQIDAGRWLFDIGVRLEKLKGDIRRERTSTFVTDATTPNLAGALRDVIWGNGTFLTTKVDTSEWAVAAGGLYKLTDNVNLYANVSRGFFFPEIRAVAFSSAGVPQGKYNAEIIKQAEAGVKYSSGPVTATFAGLYTKLENRRQVLFVNDGQGGFTERVNLVATRSYGVEATLNWRIVRHLHFDGNITLQDHKYTEFESLVNNVPTSNPAIVGNELERQPTILYNAGFYYDDDRFDASIFTNYTGDNFTASNNLIELDGFNVVNLDAGYKLNFGPGQARLGINVFNLLDTDATTEGSPRQDNSQSAGGTFFVGRPVLPRRLSVRLSYQF
jgi:outer membrane receptor protein involved in Fe transport